MFDGALLGVGIALVVPAVYFLARRVYLYNRTYIVPPRHVMLVENDGVLRTLPPGRHVLAWNDRVRRCYLTWDERWWSRGYIDKNAFPLNEIMVKMPSFEICKDGKYNGVYVDFTFTIDETHPEIFALKDARGDPMDILMDRVKNTVCAEIAASSEYPNALKPGGSVLRALENEFGVHIPYFYVNF